MFPIDIWDKKENIGYPFFFRSRFLKDTLNKVCIFVEDDQVKLTRRGGVKCSVLTGAFFFF